MEEGLENPLWLFGAIVIVTLVILGVIWLDYTHPDVTNYTVTVNGEVMDCTTTEVRQSYTITCTSK